MHRLYPNHHHYANLLLSELLYKNDYAQTNRTELLQAMDYFDPLCYCCRDGARTVSRTVSQDNIDGVCTDGACTVSTISTRNDPVFLAARAHHIILHGAAITKTIARPKPVHFLFFLPLHSEAYTVWKAELFR